MQNLADEMRVQPELAEQIGGAIVMTVHIASNAAFISTIDEIADEAPIEISFNGEPYMVTMATPLDLEDLALGFCVTEEIVGSAAEIESIHVSSKSLSNELVDSISSVDLKIPAKRQHVLRDRKRNLNGRTGCGLCGSQSVADALRGPRRVPAGVAISPNALRRALAALRQQQPINRITGATHAAAWASPDGRVLAWREDVGRHNALDKLIGYLLRAQTDVTRGFLLISSRASYEMVMKASMIGIPMIVALSAPTAYAVRVAEQAGMTLIGFANDLRQVVYSCKARLQIP